MMFGKLDKTVGLVSRLQIKQKKCVNKTKKNNHHRISFLFDFKQTHSQSNISTPPPSVSRLCFRSRPCTCNTQVYMYIHTHTHIDPKMATTSFRFRARTFISSDGHDLMRKKEGAAWLFGKGSRLLRMLRIQYQWGVYTLHIYMCVCVSHLEPPLIPSFYLPH